MPELSDGQNPVSLPPRRVDQLKRVLSGESVTQASIAAGYKSVKSGSNALADTRKRLLSTMEVYGLTDAALVRDYLVPMLNATKTITASYEGQITDTMEMADNGARLSSLDMAFKLKGSYPKQDANGPTALNICINNVQVIE